MSDDMWMVTAVTHHDCGAVTLTMRNQTTGVVKTEDYPAGAMVTRVVQPESDVECRDQP